MVRYKFLLTLTKITMIRSDYSLLVMNIHNYSLLLPVHLVSNFLWSDYGGIYLDSDVLLLKSLDPLRTYPLTLGRVDGSRTEIANGIILAKSGTDFLRLWALTYATYSHQSQYDYYSVRVPALLQRLVTRTEDVNGRWWLY